MDEALEAVRLAIKFAENKAIWYSDEAPAKMYLYRIFGVVIIASSILITFFAASLDREPRDFWGIRKSHIVAFLGIISVVSVSLSSFYDWKGSWENFRTAQFKLESLITSAEIRTLDLKQKQDSEGLFALALEINDAAARIVITETAEFYSGLTEPKDLGANNINTN